MGTVSPRRIRASREISALMLGVRAGEGAGGVVEKLEDILTRFGDKIAGDKNTAGQGGGVLRLLPDRHPDRDFFVADLLQWALKDDFHSMEHPIFSLSKKPDHRVRHYEHNGIHVMVKPGADGMATIWDKDILIYAISQLVEAMNQNRPVNRTVKLTAYDLLVNTNRGTGGRGYELLVSAFERLKGTVVQTDLRTNGLRQREAFNIIDQWKIVERNPTNSRMVAIEMTLSQWLYNAVVGREVLTLNRNYFRLDGGLERRLYELARKHCGRQAKWTVGVDLLHKKSGSQASVKKFRELFKRAALSNSLPDYQIAYDQGSDRAIFHATTLGTLGTESEH
jgi:plasmid replication initiation protein